MFGFGSHPLSPSAAMLWLALLGITACSESVELVPELDASTQSLVFFIQEPAHQRAFALDVTQSLRESLANEQPVEVFALEYDRTLREIGVPKGALVLLPANDPFGAPFPDPSRVTEARVEPGDSFGGWLQSQPPGVLESTWFQNPTVQACLDSGGCFAPIGKDTARCVQPCERSEVQLPAEPTPPNLDLFPEHWLRFESPVPYRAPWPIESEPCEDPEIRTPAHPECQAISPCEDPFLRELEVVNPVYVDQSARRTGNGTILSPAQTIDPSAGDTFLVRPGTYNIPSLSGPIRIIGTCASEVAISLPDELYDNTTLERLEVVTGIVSTFDHLELRETAVGGVGVRSGGSMSALRSHFRSSVGAAEGGSIFMSDSVARHGIVVAGTAEIEDSAIYAQSRRQSTFRVQPGGQGSAIRSYFRGNYLAATENDGVMNLEAVVLDGNRDTFGHLDEDSPVDTTISGAVVVRPTSFGMVLRQGSASDIVVIQQLELTTQSSQGVALVTPSASEESEVVVRRLQVYGGNKAGLTIDETPGLRFLVEDLIIDGLRPRVGDGDLNTAAVALINSGRGTIRRARIEDAPEREFWISQSESIVRMEDLTVVGTPQSVASSVEITSKSSVSLERIRIVNASLALEVRRAETNLVAADVLIEGGTAGLRVEFADTEVRGFQISGVQNLGAELRGEGQIVLDDGIIDGGQTGILVESERPSTWRELQRVEVKNTGQRLIVE